jgi:hypothetical protein
MESPLPLESLGGGKGSGRPDARHGPIKRASFQPSGQTRALAVRPKAAIVFTAQPGYDTSMARNASQKSVVIPGYRYRSPNIPLAAIRRFARRLGQRFQPDRIILFGSSCHTMPR